MTMTVKQLVIKPTSGLCNRLRALNSAIELSKKSQSQLDMIWELNPDCNCRFEDLFEPIAGIANIKNITDSYWARKMGRLSKIFYSFNKSCRFIDQEESAIFHGLAKENPELVIDEIHGFRKVVVYSGRPFYDDENTTGFSLFLPTENIRRIIEQYRDENSIGVHIRRTDHAIAKEKSPDELFINQMQHELELDSTVRFFLSTDDPSVEEKFKAMFPGKVDVHKKQSLDRNDAQAIKDAVVDLYCLANTKKILGSYWSSFSNTAAAIGKIELKRMVKE